MNKVDWAAFTLEQAQRLGWRWYRRWRQRMWLAWKETLAKLMRWQQQATRNWSLNFDGGLLPHDKGRFKHFKWNVLGYKSTWFKVLCGAKNSTYRGSTRKWVWAPNIWPLLLNLLPILLPTLSAYAGLSLYSLVSVIISFCLAV